MISALYAGLAMFARNLLGSMLTIAQARGRRFLAGVIDMANDLAGLASYGVGIVTVYQHGWSWISTVTVAAMMVASFAATFIGVTIGVRFRQAPDR